MNDRAAKALEQRGIGWFGVIPELVEAALVGQPLEVVDRVAEGDGRHVVHQRRAAHGTVDRDHPSHMGQQRRHVPAFEEVHAVGDAELVGNASGDAVVVDDPRRQRMVLDCQPRVTAGMLDERAHHMLEHILHVLEWRMVADLRIAVQLQRQQEGAMAVACHFTGHFRVVALGADQAKALANVARILHGCVERCVGLVMGEHRFVQRATDVIHHVVKGPGSEGQTKRVAVVITRDVFAHFPIPLRIPGKQRVTVYAIALKGDPVRTEVTLLEHVHANAQ
ncbi:hypothetical protein D3C84_544990 [compost metagenome]